MAFGILEWKRSKENRAVADAMFDTVKSMRNDLKKVAESLPAATQAELRKSQEFEWRKLKDFAKAGSWLWDRLTEDE